VAKFTAARLQEILARHQPAPQTFVETGTWIGNSTRLALGAFQKVHTIELSEALFKEHSPGLEAKGAICHHGDTRIELPKLAESIAEPVFWFLDAHWTDQCAGAVFGPLPLFDELQRLSERTYPDVICVDDVHSFISHRAAALKERPARAKLFAENPDWNRVDLPRIASYFPGHREAIIIGDQAVVYR